MQMPNNVRQGNYKLRIEGKLETGELTFSNVSYLIFQQKAVSIIIQLEKPDYRDLSVLRFRVIPVYPDLGAYFGTLDAFLIAPFGTVLKRWENVQTNAGVVSLGYLINDAPPPGRWAIKAVVMGYEAYKYFDVQEFYQWKFEVNVSMPHYFLTDSPGVSGIVVSK
jgi:CD109 antigen